MEDFPVILRMEGDKDSRTAVAFFPHAPANVGCLVCYARLGQHSEADLGYYGTTKPAKAEEALDLLEELRSIYETGEDAVRLRVMFRLPPRWREKAWAD